MVVLGCVPDGREKVRWYSGDVFCEVCVGTSGCGAWCERLECNPGLGNECHVGYASFGIAMEKKGRN